MLDSHREPTKLLLKSAVPVPGGGTEVASSVQQEVALQMYLHLLREHQDFLGVFEIVTVSYLETIGGSTCMRVAAEVGEYHLHLQKSMYLEIFSKVLNAPGSPEEIVVVGGELAKTFVREAAKRLEAVGEGLNCSLADMAALAFKSVQKSGAKPRLNRNFARPEQ